MRDLQIGDLVRTLEPIGNLPEGSTARVTDIFVTGHEVIIRAESIVAFQGRVPAEKLEALS